MIEVELQTIECQQEIGQGWHEDTISRHFVKSFSCVFQQNLADFGEGSHDWGKGLREYYPPDLYYPQVTSKSVIDSVGLEYVQGHYPRWCLKCGFEYMVSIDTICDFDQSNLGSISLDTEILSQGLVSSWQPFEFQVVEAGIADVYILDVMIHDVVGVDVDSLVEGGQAGDSTKGGVGASLLNIN